MEDSIEEIEVADEETLVFPRGIVGFEEHTRYALLELEQPYSLLQSTDDPHIGFVLAPPWLSKRLYTPVLTDEDRKLLELNTDDSIDYLCIVTLSGDGQPEALNMRAPVVINRTKMIGAQVILQDSRYPVRCPIAVSHGCEGYDEREHRSNRQHNSRGTQVSDRGSC